MTDAIANSPEATIAACRVVLAAGAQPGHPMERACVQVRLAGALAALGRIEHRQEPIDEALDLLEGARGVFDFALVPLTWSMLTDKVLKVWELLIEHGESWPNVDRERIEARAMLETSTGGRVPLDWIRHDVVLGGMLWSAQERAARQARLQMAIGGFRPMLSNGSHGHGQLGQLLARHNLAQFLCELGQRTQDASYVSEAAGLYDAIVSECTGEWAPLLSEIKMDSQRGRVLRLLGVLRGDPCSLEQAVVAHRAALEDALRRHDPVRQADAQCELAEDLHLLGIQQDRVSSLEQSISARRAALEMLTIQWTPLDCAMQQERLGATLLELGRRTSDGACIMQAIRSFESSLAIWQEACPLQAEQTRAQIARCDA